MLSAPTRCGITAVLVAAGTLAAPPGHAQDAPARRIVRIELEDGAVTTHPLPANVLRAEQRDVTEASCRSCIGRHYVYRLDVTLEEGPIARVSVFADVVGRRRSFTTGYGPYPAVSRIQVWLRDGTEVPLFGRVELDFAPRHARLRTLAFESLRPGSPVRSIRFELAAAP